MSTVWLRGVSKSFGDVLAVDDLTLELRAGELTSLLGPSGSGKTTTLRLLAGLEGLSAGQILRGDQRIERLPAHQRDIGMVFQHYALFPHLSVYANVAFGLRMRRCPAAETRRRVSDALELVRLDDLAERLPRQLSGGQQQRVALARAIAIKPALLLLDEPLSALDRKLRAEMQVELRQLQQQLQLTTLYVTHDQEEALALSDRVAVVNRGRLQQLGSPREIYERPASGFVVDFVGVANLLEAEIIQNGRSGPLARLGRYVVPLLGADLPAGQSRARLALRPEQIRLDRSPGKDALPARVSNSVYLGTSTHVYVELEDGPSLTVFVQNTAPAGQPLAPSTRVWVSWEPASLRLVRD